MKFTPLVAACLAMLVCVSCTILPAPEKPKLRMAPTAKGVRTAHDGSAVIEMKQPIDVVYEEIEAYLKNRMQLTMSNRRTMKMDANNKSKFYALDFMPLTTGKTGITIWASEGPNAPLDPYLARQLGDQIVDYFSKPQAESSLPLKLGDIEPRSE